MSMSPTAFLQGMVMAGCRGESGHYTDISAPAGSPFDSVAMKSIYKTALIVGAGDGLSASVARTFARDGGMRIALAARNRQANGAGKKWCRDARLRCRGPTQVKRCSRARIKFRRCARCCRLQPKLSRARSIVDIEPAAVAKALAMRVWGFLVAQQAAARVVPRGSGAILFTGASASVKGYPLSASFAMGKFALRGMAQASRASYSPKASIAHFVIDGGIRGPRHIEAPDAPDSMLDPDAIAQIISMCSAGPARGRGSWSCGRGLKV
jgi:NAD(P)-dependent dehydrogenase (short-subunit alcohol dehydrogenase family)